MAHAPLFLIGDALLMVGDVDIPLRRPLEDRQTFCNLLNLWTDTHRCGTRSHYYYVLASEVEILNVTSSVASLPLKEFLPWNLRDRWVAKLPYRTYIHVRSDNAHGSVFVPVLDNPLAILLVP